MHWFNISVAAKVSVIESENSFDSVDAHRRDKASVVNLNSGDTVGYQNSAPFLMDDEAVA